MQCELNLPIARERNAKQPSFKNQRLDNRKTLATPVTARHASEMTQAVRLAERYVAGVGRALQ